jgi:hypothetical protein
MIEVTIDDYFNDIHKRKHHFYINFYEKSNHKQLFNLGELLAWAYHDSYVVNKVVTFLCDSEDNSLDLEKELRWLIEEAPLHKMPLYLAKKDKTEIIAKWRLGIGK